MDLQTSLYVLERWGLEGLALVLIALFVFHSKRIWPVIKRKIRERTDTTELTKRKIDQTINSILYNLILKWGACRAYVFEYQEHDSRLHPIPFLYTSNTYEQVNYARNVTAEKENLQRIPLAAVSWWTKQLAQNKQIVLHNISEIKEKDAQSYEILENQQIQSVYCFSLLDLRGQPLGFAGIDYCTNVESRIKSEAELRCLQMECVKIAGLIAMRNNGTLEQLAGTI